MFGRDWEPATATIIKKHFKSGHSNGESVAEFLADVQPEGGGPVFRTVIQAPHYMASFASPSEGDRVKVLADPKHSKAKFDEHAPENSLKTFAKQRDDEWDAARSGAPAPETPPAGGAFPTFAQMKAGVRPAAPPAATTAANDEAWVDELQKLADLHQRGALSDVEFAAAKARLMQGR